MRYKGTRHNDVFNGTSGDDFIKISCGGHDNVDGGRGGYDRLEVDYHTGQLASEWSNLVTIAADGSMSGYLYGADNGHKVTAFTEFKNIDSLRFHGTDGHDTFQLNVDRGIPQHRLLVDLGDGEDHLLLLFGKIGAQTVDLSADGTVTSNVGIFFNVERLLAQLTKHDDVASGGSGADEFQGMAGDDTLSGHDGNDSLGGIEGDDVIDGGSGDDYLYGGTGTDLMTGGLGADRFVFGEIDVSAPDGSDTILDFSHDEHDLFDFRTIDTDPHTPRRQAFVFISQREFTGPGGTDGELRQHDNGDGTVTLQGDVNHDGIADFAVLVHTNTLLVKADFDL